MKNFNPRPPWGGRPGIFVKDAGEKFISIHALRGEGDDRDIGNKLYIPNYFNPRPPWGGRRAIQATTKEVGNFNPRPPWGGRPSRIRVNMTRTVISIHALRGEGDLCNLRTSCVADISIHALRGEGDQAVTTTKRKTDRISIHALRGEGD